MSVKNVAEQIAIDLEVVDPLGFDPAEEVERRVQFLAEYLQHSGARGYVLGISGGVDSMTAGRLAQLAVERLGPERAKFIAMRLPYHLQADESDAQAALAFIVPDHSVTVDIGPASDQLGMDVSAAGVGGIDDFHLGNIKARMRMMAQYAVAGMQGLLVVGTDHASEAVMGFFTKHGDGAADVAPLFGLTKGMVRAVARHLGAPASIIDKTPTADLESERPGLPDEQVLGVSYEAIDAFLEGRPVTAGERGLILERYAATEHKRSGVVTPGGWSS